MAKISKTKSVASSKNTKPTKKAVVKKASKKAPIKKNAKKAVPKKSVLKKAATKKIIKKAAIRKNVQSEFHFDKKKDKSNDSTIVFNINAIAYKCEDFSGATITEWFDSGREEDKIACPDDYTKVKNGYLVIWNRSIINDISFDLINDVLSQIQYWANEYDATFKSDSYIYIKDSNGNVLKKYSFDSNSWA
jgi:hypothetical protein